MTHYKMLDRAPSVVITSNRNELKLYQDNTVFLNDGDNFELRFFNPLQEKIGVEIMFNGVRKGDGFLVLNPGQDLILDRFLDEQRKMLFETYVVNGNSAEAVEAIQQNGTITFNFYKEYYSQSNNRNVIDVNYDFAPERPIYKINKNTKTKGILYKGSTGNQGYQGSAGPAGSTGSAGSYGLSRGISGTTANYSTLSNNNGMGMVNFCSTIDNVGLGATTLTSSLNVSSFAPLETGRVEKGEISDQTLKSINANFASTSFHSVSYKLLPSSTMNRTIGEVRQYCTDCGYRLRKETWTYCPKCGNKLN